MEIYYPECGPMPYESIYSIYIKLSHSNFVCLPDLARQFGGGVPDEDRSHWLITRKIERGLENNLLDLTAHLPWTHAPANALISPMATFTFCIECVKFGYHSAFNSINLHRVCPMHKRSLSVACDSCRRRFFKGFTNAHIPSVSERCDKCGFQEIGLRREIRMRRSLGLEAALDYFGRAQADWYRKIYELEGAESGYSGLYYKSDLARTELTGAGERLFEMLSPESLAGVRQFSPPFMVAGRFRTFVHERIYRCDSDFYLGDYMRLHSQVEILSRVKNRFLAKHSQCYEDGCLIAGYPDGQSRTIPLCPLALAFILLCIKASNHVWPMPGSDFVLLSDFNRRKSPKLLTNWTYREAVLVFLTILARLEYHMSKGQNFAILCRPDVVYFPNERGATLLQMTTYNFRSQCRTPLRKNLLTRNDSGGAFVALCATESYQTRENSKLRELIV